MSSLFKYKGIFLIVTALIGLSLTIHFSKGDIRQLWGIEEKVRDFVSPLEYPFVKMTEFGGSIADRFYTMSQLRKQNEKLRDRLAFLESEHQTLEEDRRENVRLRSLLALKDTVPHTTVAARIIARDPSRWVSTLILGKGRDSGIKPNMPVLAQGGLVGRVTSVSKHTASVLLILDNRSAVSGLIRRTRDIVIAEGSTDKPGFVEVKPLNAKLTESTEEWTSQVRMRVGDVVVSSGLGGVFPKGIQIGRVVSIGEGRYGVSKNALVKPIVDFGRIEEVLVVTEYKEIQTGASITQLGGTVVK